MLLFSDNRQKDKDVVSKIEEKKNFDSIDEKRKTFLVKLLSFRLCCTNFSVRPNSNPNVVNNFFDRTFLQHQNSF